MAVVLSAVLVLSAATVADAAPSAACPADAPQSVGFAGLPARIEVGPQHIFRVRRVASGWSLVGAPTVSMADRDNNAVFFSGPAEPGEVLYVQLDPTDGPIVIRATYVQEGVLPTQTTPTRCTQTLAQTVRGFRRIVVQNACGMSSVKPRLFYIACGDGNYGLRRLRWRGWNTHRARATGAVFANDCTPSCAGGRFHYYPARVAVTRPRRCAKDGDRLHYTRLRIAYLAARPPGVKKTVISERVFCTAPPQ